MSTLILGVGNILLKDEGVGVRLVERIKAKDCLPPEVNLVDGGTQGVDLIPYLEKKDCVIIIDAIKSEQEPGTIIRLQDDEIKALLLEKISPHQIGLSDLLAIMTLQDNLPKKMILFGIVPESIETGLELTPTIENKLDEIEKLVLKEVEIELGTTNLQ